MPELPEVEMWRLLAERECVGKRVEKVFAAEDTIVYAGVTPRAFAAALRGRSIYAVRRHGKQLWMELDRMPSPLFHFGMSGSFKTYRDPGDRHRYCKCELLFDDGSRLGFKNPRRLGRIRLQENPLEQEPIVSLGFDPLTGMPTLGAFRALLGPRNGSIKGVLLDQSFAAGVGNWIADEVLYQARLDPRRKAGGLSADEVKALHRQLRRIVREAVDRGADYRRFPNSWLFHRRWDLRESKKGKITDHRGDTIRFDKVAGRTTSWVPARQE